MGRGRQPEERIQRRDKGLFVLFAGLALAMVALTAT